MHKWKEDCSSPISYWTGKVLDQIPANPSLYLIKYDGFDCVYGLEIFTDERVQGLEILPDRIGMYFYRNIVCYIRPVHLGHFKLCALEGTGTNQVHLKLLTALECVVECTTTT